MPDTTIQAPPGPAACPADAPGIAAWLAALPVGTVLLDRSSRAWQVLTARSNRFHAGPGPVGVLAAAGDAMYYEQGYPADVRYAAASGPFRIIARRILAEGAPDEPDKMDESEPVDGAAPETESGALQEEREGEALEDGAAQDAAAAAPAACPDSEPETEAEPEPDPEPAVPDE